MGVTKDRFIKIFKGKISQELYDTRREKVRSALERFSNAMGQIKALEGPYQVLQGVFAPLVARFINNDKMSKLGSYPRKQAYEALDSVKDESREGADNAEKALANTKKYQDMRDDVDDCLADFKIAIDSLTEADPENEKLAGFKGKFDEYSHKREDIDDICKEDHNYLEPAYKKLVELKKLCIQAESQAVAADFAARDWTPENSGGRLVVPEDVEVLPMTDPGIKLKAKRNTTVHAKMNFLETGDQGTPVTEGTHCVLRVLAKGHDIVWVETYTKSDEDDGDDVPGPKGYAKAADFKQHTVQKRSHKTKSGKLFERMPSVDDIRQGALGDCYLVAAIAAIAKQSPNKIGDMIVDNGDGTCTVRLYNVSRNPDKPEEKVFDPVYVKIDKSTHEKSMGFSERAGGALWVQMIEKAYAAYGAQLRDKAPEHQSLSYKGIEGGHSNEAMEVILGQPSTHTDFKELNPDLSEVSGIDWPISENVDVFGNLNANETVALRIYRSGKQSIRPNGVISTALAGLTSDEAAEKLKEDGMTGTFTLDYDDLLEKAKAALKRANESIVKYTKEVEHFTSIGRAQDVKGTEKLLNSIKDSVPTLEARIKQLEDSDQLAGTAEIDMDKVRNELIAQLVKEGKMEGPSGSGQYTTAQFELAQKIKDSLDNKKAVCAGTPKGSVIKDIENVSEPVLMKLVVKILGSGEGFKAGIIATHAYTVVGIEMPDEGTVAPIFVNLRNPWGRVSRKTTASPSGSLESKISLYNAESRLELSEFTKTFDDVEFC